MDKSAALFNDAQRWRSEANAGLDRIIGMYRQAARLYRTSNHRVEWADDMDDVANQLEAIKRCGKN